MKKFNILFILLIIVGVISFSSCKKSTDDPAPQELIKKTWKVTTVKSTQGGTETTIYNPPTITDDFSKYSLSFDGTAYNYTDVNGNTSKGTYKFGADNKSLIFTDGALGGQTFNIITLNGSTLILNYAENRGAKPQRQITVTTVPA